ncbi:MAG: hypothetical protein A2Z34_04265 [Planctomycetes bacterium RBG_16_59_8]|nr:MAG: hypothetical protein A2Z34_04265 [Planctomycetes bacterium RBG_16_59_8]
MKQRMLVCLVALLAFPLPALADDTLPGEHLIGEYLAAKTDAARDGILEKLKSFDPLSDESVEKYKELILAKLKEGSKYSGKNPATAGHPRFPIKYALQQNEGEGKKSLFIFMHGGGASAKVNQEQWIVSGKRYRNDLFGIAAYPRVLDDTSDVGWWEESGWGSFHALLDELIRSFDVDTNRVYLGGVSMGGWGAFGIGTAEADRFAAIYAEAGAFNPQYCRLANLYHTPIAILVGEKDTTADHAFFCRKADEFLGKFQTKEGGGYERNYRQLKGAGHVLPQDIPPELLKWVAQHKRDPYPRKVIWEHVDHWKGKTIFYWLKVKEHEAGMRVVAELKDGNAIAVQSAKVTGVLTLFLNKRMIDFDKPVVVTLNGEERFKGKVVQSLSVILETLAAKNDPEMFFTTRIDIK